MPRSVRILPICVLLILMFVVFLWFGSKIGAEIKEVDDQYNQSRMKLSQLQEEQAELNETMVMIGTDTFIEAQARTMYGYMRPDEIRLVITNPEVLYGTEEVPAR